MRKAKALSLQAYNAAPKPADLASAVVVLACSAALILAGQPLPL